MDATSPLTVTSRPMPNRGPDASRRERHPGGECAVPDAGLSNAFWRDRSAGIAPRQARSRGPPVDPHTTKTSPDHPTEPLHEE